MKKNKLNEVNIMRGIDFKSNQERMYERFERERKQQKKEMILTFFIGIVIVAMTIMLLDYMNSGSLEKCVNAGHSKEYCQVVL